jgi:UDP-2-acetamido-3-amino-2,3-dideoxy-glucuronate N-acetyltransferase
MTDSFATTVEYFTPNEKVKSFKIVEDVELGGENTIMPFVNIYGCKIGKYSKVGPFVEIQRGVEIGEKCNICSHSFLCRGVKIGDETFIGHGVMFTNDRFPRVTTTKGDVKTIDDWKCEDTIIGNRVSIGSGATIMCGITIHDGAMIGAGSVVTKDVQPNSIVVGNPAKHVRFCKQSDEYV